MIKRVLGGMRTHTYEAHKGVRKFPFKGMDTFIDEVKSLYPSATELVMFDLDNRDVNEAPLITTRRLRNMKFIVHTVTGYAPSTRVEAVWHEVYALVEKGSVTLKVARFSIGETTP